MSWSIAIPACKWDEFGVAVDAAAEAWRVANPDQATAETIEQQEAAAEAAEAIVASGCLGDGWVTATCSGHSNPGHEVAEGSNSARDTTAVYVNRTAEPVPA